MNIRKLLATAAIMALIVSLVMPLRKFLFRRKSNPFPLSASPYFLSSFLYHILW